MTRSLYLLGVLTLVLSACQSSSVPMEAVPAGCAQLSSDRLGELLNEYPLDLLSEGIRTDLEEALDGESRVCVVASGGVVSCNAGGGPKPDMRRCCRFSEEPRATIFGIPRRIGVSRGDDQVVTLAVDVDLVNASIDRRCAPAVCESDRASAHLSLVLRGTVETSEGETDFELPVQLNERLTLLCEG